MMRRPVGLILLLLFPAALPQPALAESEEAAYWLVRMSDAVRQTTYSGVVVYSSADRIETLRVLHEYREGGVRERLTSLTGDQREIFRTNNQVVCVLPHQQVVTVDTRSHEAASLLPSLRRDNIDELRERYTFEDIGTERVADRPCRGLRVMPRDRMRYGYEYWLDEETFLPLRVTVLDADGQRIEQLMFTNVDFPPRLENEDFERTADISGYRIIRHAGESPQLRLPVRWILEDPPPGFRKLAHSVRKGADDPVPVEHFLFSDGLATISVYGANARDAQIDDVAPAEPVESRMGALNMVSRVIDGHHVTVVGEVPAKTVLWIADRLRLAPEPTNIVPELLPELPAGPAAGPDDD